MQVLLKSMRLFVILVGIAGLVGVGLAAPEKETLPARIQIVAPNGISVRIYSEPNLKSEVIAIALESDILETIKSAGVFFEVRVPDKSVNGFVLKTQTIPWKSYEEESNFLFYVILILVVIFSSVGGGVFFFLRSKDTQESSAHAAAIPKSTRRAEELFRANEYDEAIVEFNNYLSLQAGHVRNPDVYRRLTVCYQKTDRLKEAAETWNKMRELGGVKSFEDYALGVEILVALKRDADAADLFEDFLQQGISQEEETAVRHTLLESYRKLKKHRQYLKHAVYLIEAGLAHSGMIGMTANFLISEKQTDLAIESGSKQLILHIAKEFMEDDVGSPVAERIYLKCLEYDRTDIRLHKVLAKIYTQRGDFRKAVSELSILSQLDKNQGDAHLEEAAKLYVELGRVNEALLEGNPAIIKKIAQIFLAHSEVTPDAVATYEKVLEIQPEAVGINKMLSTVYLTKGELRKYMDRLRVLHKIDGQNHDYLSDLALCIIDNDLVDDTVKEGNRELSSKVLKLLIKRGVTGDRAIALLEKLLSVEPDSTAIRGALVKSYERRGEPKKCLELLFKALKAAPQDYDSLEKIATLAVEHDLLDMVLQHGVGPVVVSTALELIKRKATTPKAREIIEAAYQANPNHPEIKNYFKTLKRGKPTG